MEIRVAADGTLAWRERTLRCTLGRGGITCEKREGDGATPAGRFPLRRVFWRADRLPAPATALPVQSITPEQGWCDDPAHPAYNQEVRLPFAGSHERLWRDDGLYDLLAMIGWNDAPARPGLGSAICLHVARPDGGPTEGCVALPLDELSRLLAACAPGDHIRIEAGR